MDSTQTLLYKLAIIFIVLLGKWYAILAFCLNKAQESIEMDEKTVNSLSGGRS